ncbi:MAG: hypothetical protein HS132_14025 [Planctomycetia bacterium]|nr:hypothetical protein [Planctomycetia bacterium]
MKEVLYCLPYLNFLRSNQLQNVVICVQILAFNRNILFICMAATTCINNALGLVLKGKVFGSFKLFIACGNGCICIFGQWFLVFFNVFFCFGGLGHKFKPCASCYFAFHKGRKRAWQIY